MRDYLAAALAIAAVAQGVAPAIDYLSAARAADHKQTEAAAEAAAHPELLPRDCAIAWGAK